MAVHYEKTYFMLFFFSSWVHPCSGISYTFRNTKPACELEWIKTFYLPVSLRILFKKRADEAQLEEMEFNFNLST